MSPYQLLEIRLWSLFLMFLSNLVDFGKVNSWFVTFCASFWTDTICLVLVSSLLNFFTHCWHFILFEIYFLDSWFPSWHDFVCLFSSVVDPVVQSQSLQFSIFSFSAFGKFLLVLESSINSWVDICHSALSWFCSIWVFSSLSSFDLYSHWLQLKNYNVLGLRIILPEAIFWKGIYYY